MRNEENDEDLDLTEEFEQKGWSTPDGDLYFANVSKQSKKLKPGYYNIGFNNNYGWYFKRLELLDRNLVRFPDGNAELVVEDIKKFWNREELFRKHKFPFKRGIFMYGPPGCGKSATISLICKDVIDAGGIVVNYTDSNYFLNGIQMLRKLQPNIPIVALMEDLDQIVRRDNMSALLNLLDGVEKAVDKIVFLATTNRPEVLADNIKNRPSRFDRRLKFKTPSPEARKLYLETLFKEEDQRNIPNLESWIKESDGFSFAHVKELFISVTLLGNDFKTAVADLQKMKSKINGDDLED